MHELYPRIITRPTESALQGAIQSFSDAAHEQADAAIEDAITIIGEACAQLDEGIERETVLAWLTERGLAAGYALSFIEQAEQGVWSSEQAIAAAQRELFDALEDEEQRECELAV